jgi:hypothetical protein
VYGGIALVWDLNWKGIKRIYVKTKNRPNMFRGGLTG